MLDRMGSEVAPSPSREVQELDDASLLLRIAKLRQQGDFFEFYRRHQACVFSLARRLCGNADDAEEVLQEAFLDIWCFAGSYRTEKGDVRTFFLGIVARKALKKAGRRYRMKRLDSSRADQLSRNQEAPEDGNARMERGEELSQLPRLLKLLPDSERQLLVLYFGAGMTQLEIGAELNLTQRTVSNRIREALVFLRGEMARAGFKGGAPLLAKQTLANFFRQGMESPAGLWGRLSRRLTEPSPSNPGPGLARSAQRITPWKGRLPWAAGLACCLGLALLAWAAGVRDPGAGRPSQFLWAPAGGGTQAPPARAPGLPRSWDFEGPLPSDLVKLRGHWEHVRTSPLGTGNALRCDGEVLFRLPVELDRPVVAAFDAIPVPGHGMQFTLFPLPSTSPLVPLSLLPGTGAITFLPFNFLVDSQSHRLEWYLEPRSGRQGLRVDGLVYAINHLRLSLAGGQAGPDLASVPKTLFFSAQDMLLDNLSVREASPAETEFWTRQAEREGFDFHLAFERGALTDAHLAISGEARFTPGLGPDRTDALELSGTPRDLAGVLLGTYRASSADGHTLGWLCRFDYQPLDEVAGGAAFLSPVLYPPLGEDGWAVEPFAQRARSEKPAPLGTAWTSREGWSPLPRGRWQHAILLATLRRFILAVNGRILTAPNVHPPSLSTVAFLGLWFQGRFRIDNLRSRMFKGDSEQDFLEYVRRAEGGPRPGGEGR